MPEDHLFTFFKRLEIVTLYSVSVKSENCPSDHYHPNSSASKRGVNFVLVSRHESTTRDSLVLGGGVESLGPDGSYE